MDRGDMRATRRRGIGRGLASGTGGAAGDPLSADGTVLIELTVAMVCTGLLVAGVLQLTVDGARTFRARHRGIESLALVEAGADAVEAALEEAGTGLEGARSISVEGRTLDVSRVEEQSLQVVIPSSSAREAEPVAGGDERLADVAGLAAGDLVVGLGLVDPDSGQPISSPPLGKIATLIRDRARGPSGGIVGVAWAAPEAAVVERCGQPRALLPVTIREIAVQPLAGGLQLRRRDLGGSWQPIVDGLEDVAFRVVTPGVVEIVLGSSATEAPSRSARRRVRVR